MSKTRTPLIAAPLAFVLIVLVGLAWPAQATKDTLIWNVLPTVNTSGPTVAVIHWVPEWNADGSGAMLFSSVWNGYFYRDNITAPFSEPDSGVYVIENMAAVLHVKNTQRQIKLVTGALNWTNAFAGFSAGGLVGLDVPFRGFIAATGRFPSAPRVALATVPGRIALVDATVSTAPIIYNISGPNAVNDTCEYYYQMMKLYDLNQDGLLDIVTVRVRDRVCSLPLPRFPPFALTAEFVVFLQPATLEARLAPWPMKVLYDFTVANITSLGAGGCFEFTDMDSAVNLRRDHPEPELIIGNFFFPEVAVYALPIGTAWLDANAQTLVQRIIIDNSLGGMYDVQLVDLNRDGRAEIVATTHTTRPDNGIYAYEVIGDFRAIPLPVVVRRTIASNFTIYGRAPSSQRYRPATFTIIPPQAGEHKPSIAVGTDGGGQIVVITPDDDIKKESWKYTVTVLAQFGADFLTPILYDADNDGRLDMSVPCIGGDGIFSFELGRTDC